MLLRLSQLSFWLAAAITALALLAPRGHAGRILRRIGCRVTVACGMLEGLNLLRKTQFDLVPMIIFSSRPATAKCLRC